MKKIISDSNEHNHIQLTPISASEAGIDLLYDMQEKLHLAGDELLRMENEGGRSLNKEQNAKVSAYSKATERIRKVLLIARKILPPMAANPPICETHEEN